MMVAEESTATTPITPTDWKEGGLGFDFKWNNMGWMNSILKFTQKIQFTVSMTSI